MDSESIPILSVKYKIPSPRPSYILRDSLLQKLDRIIDRKVTIVKSGAGSGKTTLLSVYIRERQLHPVRWITMDAGMNQEFVFWSYLIHGLEEELQDHSQELKNCFEGSIQREMLEQMLVLYADRLTTEHPFYLILDDFQYIENGYLLETLDLFLTMVPASFHLILLTRTMPGIHMGVMYMDGSLGLIDEEEMRLSREECGAFLSRTLGFEEGGSLAERIIGEANGWIGGAQLMAVAGRVKNSSQTHFTSADGQVVFDYIENEIFTELSEEEQIFLEKTAVPSYFNERICEKYLPQFQFRYMLQRIMEKNLFVVQIDEQKQIYRYHAILQEFLRHRIQQDQKRKRELYEKAAEILFDFQDFGECVRLLWEIKDYDRLMDKLLKMPQDAVTFSYMMQIPMEAIVRNPNFAYQYFFCYYAALDIEKCDEIYSYIKKNLKDDVTFCGFRHANLFFDVNWEFRDVSALTYEQIEAIPLNQITKAYLLIKEAYFLFLAGQMPQAMEYLEQAEQIYRTTGNIYIKVFVLSEKTQMLEERGEFRQALSLYHSMEAMLQEVPTMEASYYIGIAGVYIRQMRLKEAKEALDKSQEMAGSHIRNISSAYLYTLAEWYSISGQQENAREVIISLAEEKIYQSVFFSARLLRYPVYSGKDRELALNFMENYDRSDDVIKNMDMELLYDGILYELKSPQEAAARLDILLAKARKTKNKLKIVECSLMKARFLYQQQGEGKRIANLLTEAVSYALPEGIRVPFWFEKDFLKELLREREAALKRELSAAQMEFIRQILYGLEETQRSPQPFMALTDREVEVLGEIAQGNPNRVIAEHLCISVATVKTHLINIYSKLGVNNRIAAVNKWKQDGS